MNQATNLVVKKWGSSGSEQFITFVKSASESCACSAETEITKPRKGPNANENEIYFYGDDCKKCLEEQKEKQAKLALAAKKMEEILNSEMVCGCSWTSISSIFQSAGDNGNCEEIAKLMNQVKKDLKESGFATAQIAYLVSDENKPIGQVSIAGECIDKFSIDMIPRDGSGIKMNKDKKDAHGDLAVEITGKVLTITDSQDRSAEMHIKADNESQIQIIEKWLFAEKKSEVKKSNNGSNSYSKELLTFITKEESPVNHVYNDYKGSKSYYCKEHDGHNSFSGDKCEEDSHYGEIKKLGIKGYGNPTIGIGHLIVGEADLKKWCDKGDISDDDVKELLGKDLELRVTQLKNALPKDAKPTKCQFDAMLSIVFNRGIGKENGKGFKSSAFYKEYIKKGNFDGSDENEKAKIKESLTDDGSKLANSQRRKNEAEIYFNCKY